MPQLGNSPATQTIKSSQGTVFASIRSVALIHGVRVSCNIFILCQASFPNYDGESFSPPRTAIAKMGSLLRVIAAATVAAGAVLSGTGDQVGSRLDQRGCDSVFAKPDGESLGLGDDELQLTRNSVGSFGYPTGQADAALPDQQPAS